MYGISQVSLWTHFPTYQLINQLINFLLELCPHTQDLQYPNGAILSHYIMLLLKPVAKLGLLCHCCETHSGKGPCCLHYLWPHFHFTNLKVSKEIEGDWLFFKKCNPSIARDTRPDPIDELGNSWLHKSSSYWIWSKLFGEKITYWSDHLPARSSKTESYLYDCVLTDVKLLHFNAGCLIGYYYYVKFASTKTNLMYVLSLPFSTNVEHENKIHKQYI